MNQEKNIKNQTAGQPADAETAETVSHTPIESRRILAELAKLKRRQALFQRGVSAAAWLVEKEPTP